MSVAAEKPKSEYRVEALARGLRILRLFSETRRSLRLNEVATLSDMPVPTAFRLAATLEEEGYLERLPDGSLRVGLPVLSLGYAALLSDDIVEVSTPSLRKLADLVGHTVNLGVLRGDEVLYVGRERHDASLVTANLQVGSTLPAALTSMGKLLLAYLPAEEVDARVDPEVYARPRGPNSVRSAAALHKQLRAIRKQGWAIQDEEVAAGLRSIAGPLRNASGEVVAAVNVAVNASASSVEQMLERLRDPLLATCDEISLRLGAPQGASPLRDAV